MKWLWRWHGNDRLTDRDHLVRRVIVLEGAANLTIVCAKLAVGLSTGSLAVLSDAVHSFTDVMNNVVAWIVIKVSSAPADRNHPYGHRKFETLAVFGLAALLVVLAFQIVVQAFRGEVREIASGPWQLALMLGVLAANIALATWQRNWANRLDSPILHADSSHTLADALTTVAVIAGWQLSSMGYLWIDKACAIAVALLISYLAFGLFQRAIPVLVDESAIDPTLLTEVVANIDGVRDVRRVRSRWVGPDRAVDLVIAVDPLLTVARMHDIADRVESALEAELDVRDVSVHIEPCDQANA